MSRLSVPRALRVLLVFVTIGVAASVVVSGRLAAQSAVAVSPEVAAPIDARAAERVASDRLIEAARAEIRLRRELARILTEDGSPTAAERARRALAQAEVARKAAAEELAAVRRRSEDAPAPPGDPDVVENVVAELALAAPAVADSTREAEVAVPRESGWKGTFDMARVARIVRRVVLFALALVALLVARAWTLRRVECWLSRVAPEGSHGEVDLREADARCWLRRGVTAVVVAALVVAGVVAAGAFVAALALAVMLAAGVWSLRGWIDEVRVGLCSLERDTHGLGDHVRLGGVSGRVERVDLWATTVRAADGTLAVVPHREAGVVENEARGAPLAACEVPVAHDTDVARAQGELLAAARDVVRDERWAVLARGEPELDGVDRVESGVVVCRLVVPARAGERDALRRAILERAVERFRSAELLLAVPVRRMLHHIERPPESGSAG